MSEIDTEKTNRTRLYKACMESSEVVDIIGDRLFASSSIDENTQIIRPFLTYRMHTDFPLSRGIGAREYVQVWANDDPGDYMRIDRLLKAVRRAIEAIPSEDDFLEARWIETGVDLADSAMNTINRYIRLQFTNTLRERT
jgi:hypothetical protein